MPSGSATLHERPSSLLERLLFANFDVVRSAVSQLPQIAASNQSMWTIVLLTFSNIFMTFAWYGHLRFRSEALWKVILVSWSIAFFEYCFQVPANRIGASRFSPVQLKVIQEVITLVVFAVFVHLYFQQQLRWNHAVSGLFLVGAVFFAFHTW